MAIKVNRVTLGFNVRTYDTNYYLRAATACPASSTPLGDGSTLICKAGGLAWFVAPASTQISTTWGGTTVVSAWPGLSACLSNGGYTPTEWFVPDIDKLQNPGYCCRTNWGNPSGSYWSASVGPTRDARLGYAYYFNFTTGVRVNAYRGGFGFGAPPRVDQVRAFRCVTY